MCLAMISLGSYGRTAKTAAVAVVSDAIAAVCADREKSRTENTSRRHGN